MAFTIGGFWWQRRIRKRSKHELMLPPLSPLRATKYNCTASCLPIVLATNKFNKIVWFTNFLCLICLNPVDNEFKLVLCCQHITGWKVSAGDRAGSEKNPKRSQSCFGFVQGYFHDLSASQFQSVFHCKGLKKHPKTCLPLSIYAASNHCCSDSWDPACRPKAAEAGLRCWSWPPSAHLGRADPSQLWSRVCQDLHRVSSKYSISCFLYMCVSLFATYP